MGHPKTPWAEDKEEKRDLVKGGGPAPLGDDLHPQ